MLQIELAVHKIGGSLAVLLPTELVDKFRLAEGKVLYLHLGDDGRYHLSP